MFLETVFQQVVDGVSGLFVEQIIGLVSTFFSGIFGA